MSSSKYEPLRHPRPCLYECTILSLKVFIQHIVLVNVYSNSLQHLFIWLLAEVGDLCTPAILSEPGCHIGAVSLQPLDFGPHAIKTLGQRLVIAAGVLVLEKLLDLGQLLRLREARGHDLDHGAQHGERWG